MMTLRTHLTGIGAQNKMSNSKANRWTADELDQLRSLLDAGKTAREIAIELDRTPSSIYGQVQRLYRKRDPAQAPQDRKSLTEG